MGVVGSFLSSLLGGTCAAVGLLTAFHSSSLGSEKPKLSEWSQDRRSPLPNVMHPNSCQNYLFSLKSIGGGWGRDTGTKRNTDTGKNIYRFKDEAKTDKT